MSKKVLKKAGRTKPVLPPFDDDPEQMCEACTYVGEMVVTAHEPDCKGHPRCQGTPWGLRQQPHMGKRCPRCNHTWAEGKV